MDSQNKESFWKQVFMRLHVTDDDRAIFPAGSVLPLDVTTARPLVGDEEVLVTKLLSEKFGKNVEIASRTVDPSVVGGIAVRYEDHIFDATVKRQLEKMDELMKTIHLREESLSGTDHLTDALKAGVEHFDNEVGLEEIGIVKTVGDGICTATGLGGAMSGELVSLHDGIYGMVQNLWPQEVGIVLLGGASQVKEGDTVRRTGKIMSIPVSEEMLGRIISPLGLPLDGRGSIKASDYRPIESPAPGIAARQPVDVPLETGLKAVDALVPIGRGQRELIIGDRQTGKTVIATDTIINQKGKDVLCIYVAIGQKRSTVATLVENLEKNGAMAYTTVVCATASELSPLQYIAPYAGCAMGEYFMNKGKHVLIIYDDLSKHAVAYRALSLLIRRPPGREAYPGDVFYLHSRLLERAAKLSDELGGGSLTALPIIETQAGDVSAYIPTNVISITDGQIFLETELFHSGVMPAVNPGISVSRVGGAAQTKIIKKLGGGVRLALAQYRELAAFAQFASDLDEATRKQLERGRVVTELMKQPQYQPLQVWEEAVTLYAVEMGAFDDVAVKDALKCERAMREYLQQHHADLVERIEQKKELSKEDGAIMKSAIEEFKKNGAW